MRDSQQFDPSGNYSARDLQKLNATFADQSESKSAATVPTHTTSKVTMWRHGEVPPLGPAAEGRARAAKQLAYARTLLTAVMEAATQMEEVMSNLVQIENEQQRLQRKIWGKLLQLLQPNLAQSQLQREVRTECTLD